MLVEHRCGKINSRAALNSDFLSSLNQNLEEFYHKLTAIVQRVNDVIHHWFLVNYLVQQIEYVVNLFNLQP